MVLIWLQFLAAAVVLILAGIKLAQFGNIIAKKTCFGGVWIGAVLLALATSLPEVASVISAGMIGATNLAVGDVLGSGMANMLILAIIDLTYIKLYRQPTILRKIAISHTYTATLAILLTALTVVFIVLGMNIQILWVGVDTLVLAIVYLLGIWLLFQEQTKAIISPPALEAERKDTPKQQEESLRHTAFKFALGALIIAITAPYMVSSAQQISKATGLGETFVGALFVAGVTSFPELVVAISAVRIGAFDLAVGNLLGSNAFNILTLFLADFAYRRGALLSTISSAHIIAGLFILLLMGEGVAGILSRVRKRYFFLISDSFLIITSYSIGMYLLFLLSAGR